jgi:UV DNA damage endonuclease
MLMLRYLGYACLCLDLPDASPRGTILRNATPERLRALIRANLAGLLSVLRFNAEQDVRLFRISSDVIPFGGHPVNTLRWWEEEAEQLAQIGRFIRQQRMRVSLHPGQYTVLCSPKPDVVTAAIRDLEFHARLLDSLGVDSQHKIVIHVGGAYGDKPAALARWIETAKRLPDEVRVRLIVENDERLFGVEDVLAASHATGTPVVFDALHHAVYERTVTGVADPSPDLTELLRAVFATWQPERDGPPKMHFSSQAAGQRPGAHAPDVDPADLALFLARTPPETPFDLMLEAKAKERALFVARTALGLTPATS